VFSARSARYALAARCPDRVLLDDPHNVIKTDTSAIVDPAEIDQSGVVPRSAVPEYMRIIFREVVEDIIGP